MAITTTQNHQIEAMALSTSAVGFPSTSIGPVWVERVVLCSTNGSDVTVQLSLYDGSTSSVRAVVSVPANSGNGSGLAAVLGLQNIALRPGQELRANTLSGGGVTAWVNYSSISSHPSDAISLTLDLSNSYWIGGNL